MCNIYYYLFIYGRDISAMNKSNANVDLMTFLISLDMFDTGLLLTIRFC